MFFLRLDPSSLAIPVGTITVTCLLPHNALGLFDLRHGLRKCRGTGTIGTEVRYTKPYNDQKGDGCGEYEGSCFELSPLQLSAGALWIEACNRSGVLPLPRVDVGVGRPIQSDCVSPI